MCQGYGVYGIPYCVHSFDSCVIIIDDFEHNIITVIATTPNLRCAILLRTLGPRVSHCSASFVHLFDFWKPST